MARKVVVTGMGVITPLGQSVAGMWARMLKGESGVGWLDRFDTDKLRSDVAALVRDFDPTTFFTRKEATIYGRVAQFSLAAAVEALDHAGLSGLMKADVPGGAERASETLPMDRARIGCLMSTGQGAVDIFEQQIERSRIRGPRAISPFFIPGVMPNSGTALVSMRFGLQGPSFNLSSACTTGTHSIATSAMMIENGLADAMLAGGAEAAIQINTVAGFGNARALTKAPEGGPTAASRPFDVARKGFVMGEGAGALVLEDEEHALARGATPLAVVTSYGLSSDGHTLTRPPEDGRGIAAAMNQALQRGGLSADAIGYINPHATSTPQGDAAEYKALRSVFGERLAKIPISATKSLLGHLLGGSGAVESIAAICTLCDQMVHPSLNVDELDPEFDLDLVRGEARSAVVEHAIKISAGFGGHNCALVFSAY